MKRSEDMKDDMNLANPYGKISCLILYLYSLELGSPPLYYEINRVCRTMDKSHLQTLGPYIKALGVVTVFTEKNRDINDKIKPGVTIENSKKLNLAGLFILYRGAALKNKWIEEYTNRMFKENEAKNSKIDQYSVSVSGSFSCTSNLTIALEFAFPHLQEFETKKEATPDTTPVLFVITCQNYEAFMGFRLNNQGYTAYPYEDEVLLCEGCKIIILDVQQDFTF